MVNITALSVTSLLTVRKCRTNSLKKEGLAFSSQFEGTAHHVGERRAAGL